MKSAVIKMTDLQEDIIKKTIFDINLNGREFGEVTTKIECLKKDVDKLQESLKEIDKRLSTLQSQKINDDDMDRELNHYVKKSALYWQALLALIFLVSSYFFAEKNVKLVEEHFESQQSSKPNAPSNIPKK